MKSTSVNCIALVLAAGLVGFATGCGKSDKPATTVTAGESGVVIEFPKLVQEIKNPSPELQAALDEAKSGLRYGEYMKALVALDKVVNTPGLTEPQKKLATQVIEQVKQALEKSGRKQ